jgi:hypothetical protein
LIFDIGWPAAGDRKEKVNEVHSQRSRNVAEHTQGRIANAALDLRRVRPIDLSRMRECLLR